MHSPEKKAAHKTILGYVQELAYLKERNKQLPSSDLQDDVEGTREALRQHVADARKAGHGRPGIFSWRQAEQTGRSEARAYHRAHPSGVDTGDISLAERGLAR